MLESENVPQGANATITSEVTVIRRATMKQVAHMTAVIFGISTDELMGKCRARRFAWPRQFCMAAIRDMGERRGGGQWAFSTTAIGRFFKYDHTSIIHGIRAHAKRMEDGCMDAATFRRMQEYCDNPQIFEADLVVARQVDAILSTLNFAHMRRQRCLAKHQAKCESLRISAEDFWFQRRALKTYRTERDYAHQ